MDRFADEASRILETARAAMRAGQSPDEITIVMGAECGIHLIHDSDWPLDSLLVKHNAEMVYRVRRHNGVLRVEGRTASQSCVFESDEAASAVRKLVPEERRYEVSPAVNFTRALPPAEIWQIPLEESD